MINWGTPGGHQASYHVRADTNDAALIVGILGEDEYHLAGLKLSGWALDIGAHVGTIAIALAMDHPNLKVIAVEPVPDNAELIRRSVASNGLSERVFVEEAGAGAIGQATVPCHYAYTAHDIPDQGYVEQNRFIGNLWRDLGEGTVIDAPVVTIPGLMDKYGIDEFRFVKIDCEGCEWEFLAEHTQAIEEMVGEWHDGPFSRIKKLLRHHSVELLTDYGGSGIFRAIRK